MNDQSESAGLKLEVGKRYVTRNGYVTTPLEPSDREMFPFLGTIFRNAGKEAHAWAGDGKFQPAIIGESPLDLVREYEVRHRELVAPNRAEAPVGSFRSVLADTPSQIGPDPINPSYYADRPIQCIDVIEEAIRDLRGPEAYLTGQVMKYLWRWKAKNGLEDLRKAQWYLERLIAKQEEGQP